MKRKKKIFIDDSFWISILDSSATNHQINRAKYESHVTEGCLLYTSNLVLGNAFSYLYKNISGEVAEQFYHFIMRAYNMGSLRLEWVGKKYSKEAVQIILKEKNISDFDLIEASIFVICKAKRIKHILSDRISNTSGQFSWIVPL